VSERITVDTGIREGQELKIVIEVNRAAVPLTQDCQPGTTDKKYEGPYDAHPPVWLSGFRVWVDLGSAHMSPLCPSALPLSAS
jgi:hypothetical protein